MIRFVAASCAVALCALPAMAPTVDAAGDSRALPMQFHLYSAPDGCAKDCHSWVAATGAITADTPKDFETFAKTHDVRGTTIALDSDGGSVLGALALGRVIRRFGMNTTVGKTVPPDQSNSADKQAKLMPRAYCESMCAFVLLAGVERQVPSEARVLVHQIWLGDRRDDPTAANYSAEDLVLVQRDIGRLAQYTVEMGGSVDLLEIALKIPPWEPMRLLTREELLGMKIVTVDDDATEISAVAATTSSPAMASGARAVSNERSWVMVQSDGSQILARQHPLTVEGDEIGNFELRFACGDNGKDYMVTYVEQRRGAEDGRAPEALTDVELSLAGKSVTLKVTSTQRGGKPVVFQSIASGRVPAELVKAFADPRSRSLMVETTSDDMATAIRVGNAGVARSFPQLTSSCGAQAPAGRTNIRAELTPVK
jgi:hypothetical protein